MQRLILKKCIETSPQSATAELVRAQDKNEAAFTGGQVNGREVEVVIIEEGPGNEVDKSYYSQAAIQDGVVKFEGARAFINHASEGEREERPEGDVRQLAGFYKNCHLVQVMSKKLKRQVSALGATLVCDESAAGDAALAKARAQVVFNQLYPGSPECYAGISINTGGWQDGMVSYQGNEWANIVAFEAVQSADIVTRPGAGGAFLRLAESMAPVGANNLEESAMKNAKAMLVLVGKLEESEKKLLAETDAAKKKIQSEESAKLRDELRKLAEADDEAGSEEPKEDKQLAAAKAMDNLKKHMPQQEGESEEGYMGRVKQAAAHMKAAGIKASETTSSEESDPLPVPTRKPVVATESAALKRFRTENAALYNQLMTSMRESLGEERKDFQGLKTENAELRTQLGQMRLERDLSLAEKELAEAGIPAMYLEPGDLVRLNEGERKRTITRTLALMEGGGAVRVWSGNGPAEEGKDEVTLSESYGIPQKVKEEKKS